MAIGAAQQIDDNSRTITSNVAILSRSTWTFAAGTTGATGAHTLFTVTGAVAATVFGRCTTSISGASTHEVGVAGGTDYLLSQIANTTTLDAGDVYTNADTYVGAGAIPSSQIVVADIILTIGSTATTGGVVEYFCLWRPLSDGATLTVTTPA